MPRRDRAADPLGGTREDVSPGLPAVIVRWRYAVLAVWAAAWGVLLAAQWNPRAFGFNDWTVFRMASRLLIGRDGYDPGPGGALHMYANMPKIQIGPPALLAALPFDAFPPVVGVYVAVAVMSAAGLLLVLLAERIGSALVPDRELAPAVLVGGLLVLPAWGVLAALAMHLDDLMVLLAAGGAMLAIARGRTWPAVLLLGVAVATKPWALVLLPVLWGLPRDRRAMSLLGVLGVAALFWAPFVLAAPDTISALGSVRLPVADDSTLRLIGLATGDEAPSWVRAAQLLVAIVVGVAVARRGHWYAVPLAAVAIRLAVDPQTYAYYGAGLVVAAFLLDGARRPRAPVITALALAVAFVPMTLADAAPLVTAVLRLAGCVALVVVAWAPERLDLRGRRSPASTP